MSDGSVDLNHWQQTQEFFSGWEDELRLRHEQRLSRNPAFNLSIAKANELDLYYRSWYFSSRRVDFFSLLVDQLAKLDNIEVLKWLGDSPHHLRQNFWGFLPWHILLHSPNPTQLQFIVNLYSPEFQGEMVQVVNALNLASCQYLASRTANLQLRQLFKKRESELMARQKREYYGFVPSKKENHPGLYGDKTDMIFEALELLESSRTDNYRDPYGSHQFTLQLAAAEAVFKAGLPQDSLFMLMDIYQDYQRKNRLVNLLDDEQIHRSFSRLLRQVIPLQSLLSQPLNPYQTALKLYVDYFPLINRDPGSLQYLTLYESIASGFNQGQLNIIYEIYAKSSTLMESRPYEPHWIQYEELQQGIGLKRARALLQAAAQKISALPHESFVLLEYLRLGHLLKMIKLDGPIISEMMGYYLMLWDWLPLLLFMNKNIYTQLAPLAGESKRQQAKQICDLLGEYQLPRLLGEISSRPELLRAKEAGLKRQLLKAYFLGVLK